MNNTLSVLKACGAFLLNKAFAFIVLLLSVAAYLSLPSDPATPIPFVEVLYAGILLISIIIIAPFLRLLVFPEAAEYAESDALRDDLKTRSTVNPALLHYWFATLICYAAAILCVTSLLNLK